MEPNKGLIVGGDSSKDITELLLSWKSGNQAALDELMPLVYQELKGLAASYLRRERPDHTLQATALVNEAYVRLVDSPTVSWQNRAHFFGIAARIMRQILVNHALKRNAAKRGGFAHKLSLDEAVSFADQREVDLIALDDALKQLETIDPQKSRIIELRFFGGLSIAETAEALGVSHATVERNWKIAKLWLRREISKAE
jgi:RNA polymerase sigma factor (TIGR02999 family)